MSTGLADTAEHGADPAQAEAPRRTEPYVPCRINDIGTVGCGSRAGVHAAVVEPPRADR